MPPKAAVTGAGLLTSSKPLQPRRPPAKGGAKIASPAKKKPAKQLSAEEKKKLEQDAAEYAKNWIPVRGGGQWQWSVEKQYAPRCSALRPLSPRRSEL